MFNREQRRDRFRPSESFNFGPSQQIIHQQRVYKFFLEPIRSKGRAHSRKRHQVAREFLFGFIRRLFNF
jgi:hypothetical protein